MRDEAFARAGETLLGDVVAIGALLPAAGDLVAVRSRVDATVEFDAASGTWKAVVFGISRDGSPMDKFGSVALDNEVEIALDHIVSVLKSAPAP
ncbi:hypothetical protein P3W85_22525 [Cupriavidus basilensis]|uniref:Uncharacterized protein n=1 Tax=Cupriavidus basilensis TaxID=68895 RepID=A0ABT6ASU9_9BURK|nr:hypothetical protein [Cupriavidus basilensis]MDF3835702.1 hypothetical protein [Cupriavidus basilensis]